MRLEPVGPRGLRRCAGLGLAAAVIVVSARAQPAQQAACDQGVIQLPARINAPITICSALAEQVPALARQLQQITAALGTEQQQIAEMNRLVKGVNAVSQNIGADRQTALLRNLFAQLQISQRVSQEQAERQMQALADGFERLTDQLLGVLMNRATADRASAAVDGPLGDAIAQLDLTGAEQVLTDIRSQLQAIGTQVAEVNRRTVDIQNALDQQRLEVPRVSSSLAAADLTSLRALSSVGLPPSVLEEALRAPVDNKKSTTAARFFEHSVGSPAAVAWFESAMSGGADPNLTVPGSYYDQEGLLIAAMRAGNAQAMKVLLARGASPHAYQSLWLTRFADTRFLFPLGYVASDDRLTLSEKQEVAAAFLQAGAVVPPVVAPKDRSGWPSVMYAVNQLHDDLTAKLGLTVPAPALCCAAPTPICLAASRVYHDDWCAALAAMPTRLRFKGPYQSSPIYDVELKYALLLTRAKAYFLALTKFYEDEYVVAEVSRDGSSWTVLSYMSPRAGMGLCKLDEGSDVRVDYCWRAMSFQRVAGTTDMRLSGTSLTWTLEGGGATPADRK